MATTCESETAPATPPLPPPPTAQRGACTNNTVAWYLAACAFLAIAVFIAAEGKLYEWSPEGHTLRDACHRLHDIQTRTFGIIGNVFKSVERSVSALASRAVQYVRSSSGSSNTCTNGSCGAGGGGGGDEPGAAAAAEAAGQ